ncbi:MAG: Cell division ATP-binding protein FtsE [Syntrophorhabdaceae bacterium PtaU1.Bin034]|nr:MAG: Cell division ATP-binding protein FtsE [Syntrophorhabdaceae bacterium PtaU1.Bin034]
MIHLANVKKTFNMEQPNEYTAVDGVNLTLQENRVTVLQGPSGSGKTTLLSLIGCMVRPTSGRIKLRLNGGIPGFPFGSGAPENGEPSDLEVTSLPERFLTGIRRKTFGFVFQQFHLVRGLSALENVMLPAYPLGEPLGVMRKRAIDIMETLSISHRASAKVEWLSGGEAQRIAIARALMNDPPVIIADEPTAHLDTALSHEFMLIVSDLKGMGKTAIIASHDPLVCESSVVSDIVTVRNGRVIGHAV